MIPLRKAVPEVFDHNLLETEDENSTVIYCDMDGVLADFDVGFKLLSGGKSADQFDAEGRTNDLWKLILNSPNNGIDWWATLPKTNDCDVLWKFITSSGYPVKILSSTSSRRSNSTSAEIGKRRWLSIKLSPVPKDENIILVDSSEAKKEYALGPNHILIDDLPSNIAQWRATGGTAIEHKNATDSIMQLKKVLGITQNMKARIYNDTLNPNIWNNDKTIKPEVRDALLKVAQDFYAESELTSPIQDIYVLGSAANYNWGPNSDVDVHVLVDFNKLSMERDLVKKMVDSIKANWNKNHNIQIKNHRVELYIQDITEKNRALGIYSILNNKWIKVPQKLNLNLDKNAIQQKYSDMSLQIKSAIKSNNLEDLKRVLKAVYDMRESGLIKSGEFSTENIVFKLLRNRGHLDNLKTSVNKVYDTKLSLKES